MQRKIMNQLINLTKREIEVLRLVKLGKTNAEISNELHISINTVKTHVSHILHKKEKNQELN